MGESCKLQRRRVGQQRKRIRALSYEGEKKKKKDLRDIEAGELEMEVGLTIMVVLPKLSLVFYHFRDIASCHAMRYNWSDTASLCNTGCAA